MSAQCGRRSRTDQAMTTPKNERQQDRRDAGDQRPVGYAEERRIRWSTRRRIDSAGTTAQSALYRGKRDRRERSVAGGRGTHHTHPRLRELWSGPGRGANWIKAVAPSPRCRRCCSTGERAAQADYAGAAHRCDP
jgi:hypothetical protein